MKELFHEVIHGLFKERFANAIQLSPLLGGALPLCSKKRQLTFNGAVLLGDAAGLINPLTGEGIGDALFSGYHASKIIIQALQQKNYSQKFLKQYEKNFYDEVGKDLFLSTFYQRILKYPWILNAFSFLLKHSLTVRKKAAHLLFGFKF